MSANSTKAIKLDNDDFSEIEVNVLKKWKEENTFQNSLRGDQEFIFSSLTSFCYLTFCQRIT